MGVKSCWNSKIIFGNCWSLYAFCMCSVVRWVFPDVSTDFNAFIFNSKQSTTWPWRRRHQTPLKSLELLTHILQDLNPCQNGCENFKYFSALFVCASDEAEEVEPEDAMKPDPEIEKQLLWCLSEASLTLPTTSRELAAAVGKQLGRHIFHIAVVNLLQKFTTQQLIVWVMVPHDMDCEWTKPPTEVYDYPFES